MVSICFNSGDSFAVAVHGFPMCARKDRNACGHLFFFLDVGQRPTKVEDVWLRL